MLKEQSYRQIFKATSLFGSVQVVNVLTGILRSKFVAIFLGPTGMGISSLLATTINLIITVSGMGLNFSAVKYISQANELGDNNKLSFVLKVFKRWLWVSCVIGTVFLLLLSQVISQFTFGNKTYTLSFVILSLMLIFTILTNGNTALLQSTRQLKLTAKSTVIGSVLGLITTIPIYYFYGIKGIVPSLVFGAIVTFSISEFFARKVSLTSVKVSKSETIHLGGEMAQLGVVMVLGQIIGSIVIYSIDLFIRKRGGITDVGLYQAGTMITSQSMGLVYSAMAMDYFPRLSAVSNDKVKVNQIVDQQLIITVLVACPILVLLIVFAPLIIHILLSKEFYVIADFVRWLALGTLFTAPSVVLGYIALAKGDKKTYFLYCTFFNSLFSLVCYIIGYVLNGLIGMGIAICFFQIVYVVFICFRFHQIYSFSLSKYFLMLFSKFTLFCIGALIATQFLDGLWVYLIGGAIFCLSSYYSWQKLDKLVGLKELLKEKILKR